MKHSEDTFACEETQKGCMEMKYIDMTPKKYFLMSFHQLLFWDYEVKCCGCILFFRVLA